MRASKIDENQPEIVEAFRKMGCSVAITSAVGKGFPDIVVGCNHINLMVEIKDGSKAPSKQKLTSDQIDFHGKWLGSIEVVKNIDDVTRCVKEYFGK